jgi:hypothetical protein
VKSSNLGSSNSHTLEEEQLDSSSNNKLISNRVLRFSSLIPNLHIMWKSCIIISVMFLFHLALILVDIFTEKKKKRLPPFLFGYYDYGRVKTDTSCREPLVPFAVNVTYVITFLIIYTVVCTRMLRIFINKSLKRRLIQSLIVISTLIIISTVMRAVELVANIVVWRHIDHLFRVLTCVFDMATSTFIITSFVILPLFDIVQLIENGEWESILRETILIGCIYNATRNNNNNNLTSNSSKFEESETMISPSNHQTYHQETTADTFSTGGGTIQLRHTGSTDVLSLDQQLPKKNPLRATRSNVSFAQDVVHIEDVNVELLPR